MSTIVAQGVSYHRGGRAILDRVSMSAAAGESIALVGPSGSGKSSLLALLARLERPDDGTIALAGEPRLGLVLQGYGLVSVLTAAENVEVALQSTRLAKREVRRRAEAVLASVGLNEVADHLVEELSGGQQQRVAAARALAIEPTILLADEPTAELDHDWKDRIVALLLDVTAQGGTVVLATHDPTIAERCTRQLHLVDGRTV